MGHGDGQDSSEENSNISTVKTVGSMAAAGIILLVSAYAIAEPDVRSWRLAGPLSPPAEEAKATIHSEDSALRDQVEIALISLPDVVTVDIDVAVENGIVTLSGKVTDQISIEQAKLTAGRFVGSDKVHNKLRIVPKSKIG